MKSPRVSVLMGVYNGEEYLQEAIDSVLSQTFVDFEFLIIDDGSTDGASEILKNNAKKDSRIRLICQANQGLTKSLNNGLAIACGDYIARMDGDDICFPTRLESQVAYLDASSQYVAIGSFVESIDGEGQPLGLRQMKINPKLIDKDLLSGITALAHPAVMIRKSALNKISGYSEEYKTSQDLDLFLRLSEIGPITNLEKPLLYYRWHDGNISVKKVDQQDSDVTAIIRAAYERRGLQPPKGVPISRWNYRRAMAVQYARNRNGRQALRFALQAIKMRFFNPRSWYTLFNVIFTRLANSNDS